MRYRNTKEYLNYVAHHINLVEEKVLFFLIFMGPVIWIATQFDYLSVPFPFCIGYSLVTFFCTMTQHFFNKKENFSHAGNMFGLISITFLIPTVCLKLNATVHALYGITIFISCLYMQIWITRLITVLSYSLIVLSTFIYFTRGITFEVFLHKYFTAFLGEVTGLTVEVFALYMIAACIVRLTERLLKEREMLYNQKKEADEESSSKSEFLAQISHEIRTPINAVLGMNEMILQEGNEPEVKAYAMTIRSAGKTLLSIVNDILDYSRIESGKMEIIFTEYDVAASFKEIIDIYSVQCAHKGIQFIHEIPKDMPRYLSGDELRIKQAVGNLLSNAVKYTEKGTVHLKITFYRKSEDTGRMVISVSDTGIGIRQEDIGKLFEKYGRLDLKRNRRIQGTGLGLKICKQTVEMMGGVLNVQSEYGEGSVFSIALDQKIVKEEPIGEFSRIYEKLGEKGMKDAKQTSMVYAPDAQIMIVDDNEMNLYVASNLLKKSGSRITCFLSGKECLEEIYRKHYDLILLDHMMPELDGVEVLKQIRNRNDHLCSNTSIVVLTANATSGAREQYLELGFDDYISKPISVEELDRVLRRNLPTEKMTLSEEKAQDNQNLENQNQEKQWDLSSFHIDVQKGMGYLDGELEPYLSMVEIFCNDYDVRREKLGKAMEKDDLAEYAVLVHGLKGNARTLGADQLGELAFEEEKAAKDGNMEFILTHQYEMGKEWELVIEGFQKFLSAKQPEKKEEISSEEFEDQILMAMACMEERQSEQAKEILQSLMGCEIKSETLDAIKKSLEALEKDDFHQAILSLNKEWKGEA